MDEPHTNNCACLTRLFRFSKTQVDRLGAEKRPKNPKLASTTVVFFFASPEPLRSCSSLLRFCSGCSHCLPYTPSFGTPLALTKARGGNPCSEPSSEGHQAWVRRSQPSGFRGASKQEKRLLTFSVRLARTELSPKFSKSLSLLGEKYCPLQKTKRGPPHEQNYRQNFQKV